MISSDLGLASEVNYINWDIQQAYNGVGGKETLAANFQDIYNLTKRSGDLELKMSRIKFKAQGIGGILGAAAGALGGPFGTTIGFSLGRALGSYVGGGLAQKYYGAEQTAVNEGLFSARQRSATLKYNVGLQGKIGDLITTMRKNSDSEEKKVLQDMLVL